MLSASQTLSFAPGGAQHATQPNFAERGNRNARNNELTKSTMPNRNLPENLSVCKSTTERCNYIYDSPDNAGYPVYDSTVCVSLSERSASTRALRLCFRVCTCTVTGTVVGTVSFNKGSASLFQVSVCTRTGTCTVVGTVSFNKEREVNVDRRFESFRLE